MAGGLAERTWRPSTPESIEDDLASLWREVARASPVARAVMSNLVVFRTARDAEGAPDPHSDRTLESIVARHPSRVIIVEHAVGAHAGPPVAASVGIATFGPPSARYAVEQLIVRSRCIEASLPSIVRRFLRGDVPTSIWWTDDTSKAPPVQSVIAMARQFLYDSRTWRDIERGIEAVAPLADAAHVDLADLNWRRLSPLRQALVHAAGSVECDLQPADVTIVHRPGDAALAWLLAGWLSSQLEWPRDAWPRVTEARRGDDVLSVTAQGRGAEIRATLNGPRVIVEHSAGKPFTIPIAHEGDADAIAAELRNLSADRALRGALAALIARRDA